MGDGTLKCKDCGGELDEFDFEVCGRCKKKGRKTYDLKADDEESQARMALNTLQRIAVRKSREY